MCHKGARFYTGVFFETDYVSKFQPPGKNFLGYEMIITRYGQFSEHECIDVITNDNIHEEVRYLDTCYIHLFYPVLKYLSTGYGAT